MFAKILLMGYGYGFLLSIVKLPPSVTEESGLLNRRPGAQERIYAYVQLISRACEELQFLNPQFPRFDELGKSGTLGYGCGGDNLLLAVQQLCVLFPEVVFAVYHFYYDFFNLDIYTISGRGLLREDYFDGQRTTIGPYKVAVAFDFANVAVVNHVPVNRGRAEQFAWEGNMDMDFD